MTDQGQFKLACNALRAHILTDSLAVKDLKTAPLLNAHTDDKALDKGEALANIMLAYRHLEDARMRLGKAIQATEGGMSIYDRSPGFTHDGPETK